jgi:hypothetical protein
LRPPETRHALPVAAKAAPRTRRATPPTRQHAARDNHKTTTQADTRRVEALFTQAGQQAWGAAQWVAASNSRSDVSRWRRLVTWPHGEEGGVFRFNKAGDGLYVITSSGRCARGCVAAVFVCVCVRVCVCVSGGGG